MFDLERGFEQGIVLQIDLPDRKIVRRAPICVHFLQQIGRQRGRHLLQQIGGQRGWRLLQRIR